ncbi:MAG: lipoate--protein ligase family protein [Bacteroidia bacterium]|nr:lipoate--protein ligase family protein [Bacteroidia bacterium]
MSHTHASEKPAPPMKLLPWQTDYSETSWDNALNVRLDALEFDLIIEPPRAAAENLALDEALLFSVADGSRKAVFRMWDWSERSVILGSYQSVAEEIDADVAGRHGFSFGRRMSGGGAMVVEPEKTITWSLIVPEAVVEGMSFRQSFAFLDMWCVRALRSLGIPATYRPINDIASPSGKIAGAAQCRRRRTVLHHTTMAYELDGEMMWQLLRLDTPRTHEKSVASAVKRVSPLRDFTDLPHGVLRDTLTAAFAAQYLTYPSVATPTEIGSALTLIEEKYSTQAWLYRLP